MRYLLPIILSLSCSHGKNREAEPETDDRILELQQAFEDNLEATKVLLDPVTGWPSNTDCDGALWAGLACAVGLPASLDLAEYSPGEYHRRPAPSCWNKDEGDVGSKSTISNDMFQGIFWCRWRQGNIDALVRIADYGEAHSWIMGEPKSMASRVLLKPNSKALLGRLIGRDYSSVLEGYFPVTEDYERHLQALSILLQGEATAAGLLDINDQMLERLRELVSVEPKNPLFHAALGVYTGDFSEAIALLLDPVTPVPSYVRGLNEAALVKIEWLFAADIVLKRYK